MSAPATSTRGAVSPLLPDLLRQCRTALNAAESIADAARRAAGVRVVIGGKLDARALDRDQFAAHGFAWLSTYVTALAQLLAWAERLEASGRLGETEALILQIGFGEYLAQIGGGLAMSQGEIVRPVDLGLSAKDLAPLEKVEALISAGNSAETRAALSEHIADGRFGEAALDDEALA